jgi:hypothetical protein
MNPTLHHAEKIPGLVADRHSQSAESAKPKKASKANLGGLGYEG